MSCCVVCLSICLCLCDMHTHPTGRTAEYVSGNDVVLYGDVSNTVCELHQHHAVIGSSEVQTQVLAVF